jgi:hypothetical protein
MLYSFCTESQFGDQVSNPVRLVDYSSLANDDDHESTTVCRSASLHTDEVYCGCRCGAGLSSWCGSQRDGPWSLCLCDTNSVETSIFALLHLQLQPVEVLNSALNSSPTLLDLIDGPLEDGWVYVACMNQGRWAPSCGRLVPSIVYYFLRLPTVLRH